MSGSGLHGGGDQLTGAGGGGGDGVTLAGGHQSQATGGGGLDDRDRAGEPELGLHRAAERIGDRRAARSSAPSEAASAASVPSPPSATGQRSTGRPPA